MVVHNEAFPKEERVSFAFFTFQEKRGKGCFYEARDEGQFVGLVYTIVKKKFVYIFYLAVSSHSRGHGYGSLILDAIKEQYPKSIFVLLIEDTDNKKAHNYKQRLKRLAFYQKNGFHQTHTKIIEQGVKYEIMATASIKKEEYYAIVKPFFSNLFYYFIHKDI